jgi:DNA modification methylase
LVKPYYQDDAVTIYHGDCREIAPNLPCVDTIVTDPPYGMKNDNDYSRFTGGPNSHGDAASRTYPPTVGDDEAFEPSPWLGYSGVVLWGSNHYAARLPVGTTLVWIKRLDGGFGSFLSDAEIGWMKGGHGVYCFRDLSMFSETNSRAHPNQKPHGLMSWCIRKMPPGTVLDPYMGSGTTLRAAKDLGRKAIGIEIEERYCEIAARRCAQEVMDL